MKIEKFNKFRTSDTKIVKESAKKEPWRQGDVNSIQKLIDLINKQTNSLEKNQRKLEKLLDSHKNKDQGYNLWKVAEQGGRNGLLQFQSSIKRVEDLLQAMFSSSVYKK
jgi:hypothetical protein|tara:strand:+ start:405 stop:731 length:327 start_codon:yes stop_codon:yes gene_type:complete